MCLGGSGNQAQDEAMRAEEARRKQVLATQKAVEGIYNTPEREGQIGDLIAATREFLTKDLSKKNTAANRSLKFALARNGQTMGSVDADQRRDLGQEYLRGALETERRSQAAGQSLRQADQASKLALFGQAQGGLDMTTSVRNAGESLRSNIGVAKADALQSGLGDLFNSFSDIYKNSREARGRNDAEKYQYGGGTYYAPNQYFAGASSP